MVDYVEIIYNWNQFSDKLYQMEHYRILSRLLNYMPSDNVQYKTNIRI